MKKKTVGVYKVTHNQTGHFYIGSSVNCEMRFYQHQRNIRRGEVSQEFQAVIAQHGNDFRYEVVKKCQLEGLETAELKYLTKFVGQPLCLNTRAVVKSPARGRKRTVRDGNNKARALVGKNSSDGTVRPSTVTFVSPEGTVYRNVRSVARFARQHNLTQSLLNGVAQGKVVHHRGWRLEGTPLSECFRRMQGLNEVVVSPDGTEYQVTDLHAFCKTSGAPYGHLYRQLTSRTRTRPRINRNTDKWGRAWRVKGVGRLYRVVNQKSGEVYENVANLTALARTLNLSKQAPARVLKGESKRMGWTYTVEAVEEAV